MSEKEINNLIQTGEIAKVGASDKLMEAARSHADQQLEELREEHNKHKKSLIKLSVMGVLTVGILVFASIAWFTMNREVGTSGMGVKTATLPFELAVPSRSGADTYYNSLINDFGYLTGESDLTTERGSIRWVMKDESKNTSAEDYRGFSPGSYGKLTFYILPKTDTNAKYNLKIDLSGYCAEFVPDTNDPSVMTKEIVPNTFKSLAEKADGDSTGIYSQAAGYLKGHIMFFQELDMLTSEELNGDTDTNKYYSGRIIDSFVYDTSEHQSDKTTLNGQVAYEVNIYWIWPNTFGQIVLDADDDNLFGNAMFSSKQSGVTTPRAELTNYITSNPSYFFSTSDLQSSGTVASLITPSSLSSTNALITLSNGYNGADQIIGENAQFVLVEMTVELYTDSGE